MSQLIRITTFFYKRSISWRIGYHNTQQQQAPREAH